MLGRRRGRDDPVVAFAVHAARHGWVTRHSLYDIAVVRMSGPAVEEGRRPRWEDDCVAPPAPLRSPSHLTLAWLQQTLTFWRRQPIIVASFTVDGQGGNDGFLSEILFVDVRYTDGVVGLGGSCNVCVFKGSPGY